MERLIHVLLFSAGLCVFIQSISSQQSSGYDGYVLIQDGKTWEEAQAYCRHNHFDLITVQSTEDRTRLSEAVDPALVSLVWTGLYNDINSWRWSHQDENMTFLSWESGQPDNRNGKQECICIESGKWSDTACSGTYPVFCYNEMETGTNRFVYISDISRTWHEAQSYCRQYHTDLATVQSQTENDQLMNVIGRAWIGLFRDSWKWSDGTSVSTSPINWKAAQPDMTGMERPCGAAGPDGLIDDQLCRSVLPFICKQNSQKQIVRLEVKSGQNVNDPAVMETIAQWMKQKLKNHGIEKDTRLTWRVQTDGNVFSPKHNGEQKHNQKYCSHVINT